MKQKNAACSVLLIFLIINTVLLAACKSNTATTPVQQKPLETHELLSQLPANSVGFFIWDLEKPSYKEFQTSPWGSSATNLFSSLKDSTDIASTFDVLNKSIADLEFWNSLHTRIATVAASMYFVDSPSLMGFATIVKGLSPQDIEEIHAHLKAQLESELFSISKEGAIYTAKHGGKELSLYYSVQNEYLYVSSQKDIVAQLPVANTTSGITNLIAHADFMSSVEKLPARNKEYFLGYIHTNSILDRIPAEAIGSLSMSTDMPLRSIAINRSLSDGPLDSVAISLTDDAKKSPLLAALSGRGNLSALDSLPPESVIGLGLDGALIGKIITGFLETVPAARQSAPDVDFSRINSLISFGLGFEDVAPGALFPGLCLSFTTAPDSQLAAEIKKLADMQFKSAAGIEMAWQEKTIAEIPVQYILTPLGIGLYLAELPGQIFVTSSEPALQKMLTAHKSGNSYNSALPASLRALTSSDTIARITISFPALVTAIKNLSGSLAMFTGGQPLYEQKQDRKSVV